MSRDHHRGLRAAFTGALVATLAVGVTAGLTGSGASAATEAAGQVRVPAGAKVIPNHYIVVLGASGAQGVAQTARTLATRHGGSVTHTYSAALKGFAVRATAAEARALAAEPGVAYVEQDTEVRLADTQPNATWGLDRIDQRDLPLSGTYTYNTTASNVSAYIIDTGIRITHTDFGGRASVGTDTVGDGRNGIDCHGHGTHVAGTVGGRTWGVAKAVRLYAVRVLSCSGSGTNAGVIGGVDWVTRNAVKPAVANMSLGGSASTALDNAVANSISSGVTYALAAGNENQSACNVSPARTPTAITVGATTNTDARASFSNWGPCVDIFAPGSGITSAWATGDTATNTISGTSMASPHVAGGAALWLAAHPNDTPQQVRDGLVANATDGKVGGPGSGSPNKLLYTLFDSNPQPPGKYFENTTPYPIPEYPGPYVESPITVAGVPGNAPANLQVGVNITHTWRGDLTVRLIAPDGTQYLLHNRTGGSADNIVATYTVNALSETANGTWKLRVQDHANLDTGRINKWSLQF
jgi:subtilisin family serine protease